MRKIIQLIIILCTSTAIYAQVGIGTTNPNTSANLEILSSTGGILIPRMTQAQRNLITVGATQNGLLIYQTDATPGFYYYNGTAWVSFGGGSGWSITGNSGTSSATNYIGTTDVKDFVVKTNGNEAMRFTSNGKIGIANTNPQNKLHLGNGTGPVLRIQDGNQTNGYLMFSDASGNATWTNPGILGFADFDWDFVSGTTNADVIKRSGQTTIGVAAATDYNPSLTSCLMDIDNGTGNGTQIGVGSNEYIHDYDNLTGFSHNLVPIVNNSISLGTSANRWDETQTVNGINSTSDLREKTQIKPLSYGLNTLLKLRPVSYNWKKKYESPEKYESPLKKMEIGFIAQELQKQIPEVVISTNWVAKRDKKNNLVYVKENTPNLLVTYDDILPVIVKATQEHQYSIEQIEKQTQKIEELIKKLK
ncbi:tail fiber domain-containing protein [Flavobacterium sp. F372]|uniref:Tail fiber domain-containing protein n=1 Tax=Flavobacterium bernardetii TaxID=2813823 RepID=A0ABR7IY53_9FLAO|nr:tail fiber domain-containing protein [Flavobacterium bernardetii]MBC5834700.1 tail fiber domain-containing protein [Flavobacterium bernardetii]NHF70348.1 tail fiber domain-containing protein [Flavobacterium bernardetii]